MAFTNGASGAMLWLPAECGQLLGQLLGVPADAIRTDVPQHPETWGDICGWYKVSARLVDTRVRSLFGLGTEVFVRGGRLMVRVLSPIPALYRGFVLHPDDAKDPYVFRIDASEFGMGTQRVVFSCGAGETTRLHLEVMPLSLQKQPALTKPRLWMTGALDALAVAASASAVRLAVRARP